MHRLMCARYHDITGMDIHHINFNGLDNRLCNLAIMTVADHMAIHSILFSRDRKERMELWRMKRNEEVQSQVPQATPLCSFYEYLRV